MFFEPKIGFFALYPFHKAMLQPVYEQLRNQADCLISDDYQAMIKFQPSIILLAEHHDAFFRSYLPETLIVSTTHGFGFSKNYVQQSMPWFDFVCIPSEWYREYSTQNGWLPRMDFWVTGFSAMDGALQADTSALPPILSSLPEGPRLLFAPTFTEQLTGIEVLGNDWMQALQTRFPTLNIIVKLHPHTARLNPEWVERYQRLTAANPRLLFIEDSHSNIYDLLPHTDILLSDVSSVVFSFLYYDRPIILINNPQRTSSSDRFEPKGLIWTWRDMAQEVNQVAELPDAVQRALDQPEEKSTIRQRYRQRRFGDQDDGLAAQRIADQISTLIKPKASDQAQVRLTRNTLRSFARYEREKTAAEAAAKQQNTTSFSFSLGNL